MRILPKAPNLKVIFIVFVMANIIYCGVFIFSGKLGGDFRLYAFDSSPLLLLTSLIVVLVTFWFFLVFLWGYLERIRVFCVLKPVSQNQRILDIIFLVIAIYLLLYRTIYGGSIGSEQPHQGDMWAHYIAALIVPSWLVTLYLFYRLSAPNKLYFCTLSLYIIADLASGLTGSLILCFFIYLTHLYKSKSKFPSLRVLLSLVAGILIYPIFRIAKRLIIDSNRMGEASFDTMEDLYSYQVLINKGFIEAYLESLNSSFQRLQMISSQHYIFEHLGAIKDLFYLYDGRFFFENVWLYSMLVRRLGIYEVSDYSLQNIIALSFSGNANWSSLAGFWGHVLVNPPIGLLFILVNLILVFFISWLAKLYDSKGYLLQYVWWVILAYVVNGWFFALVEISQAFILFGLILLIVNGFKVIRINRG